jgi:signal transduction histidine kinase
VIATRDSVTPLPEGITERDVLIEQLRLIYTMLRQANLWTLTASFLVAWYLRDSGLVILAWLACQIALKAAELIELRWFLSDADVVASPEKIERRLCITQSLHALGWTSLPWLVNQSATASQMILVVAVLSGVCGGAVITYGSSFRVFSCYVAIYLLMLTGLQFTDAHETAFGNLTFVVLIFGAGMWGNAFVHAGALRRSILLRFENVALNRKLTAEAAELEKARERAEAANLSKSRFLASASHDLRQPIHALSMLLSAMEGELKTARQRGLLRQSKSAQLATAELLDALLDFSRADAGAITAKPRPFALQTIFDQLSNEMAVVALEKGILFTVRETGIAVTSDPSLALVILRNLTLNAIRYTGRGGVLVAARRRGAGVVVEVWDTGIGIPEDCHAEIFEEFLQLGNSERDRKQGLGLGLAIAGRIAGLLDTRIELRSQPGRGSVFRFALPPCAGEGPVSPVPVHADRPVAFPARQVLVVDDDDATRTGTEALFEAWDISCASAETISEALARAGEAPPDLLICDYRLRGGETGVEAIAQVRQRIGSLVPALLVTGDTQVDSDTVDPLPLCRVIRKPMRTEDLVAFAAELFSRAGP